MFNNKKYPYAFERFAAWAKRDQKTFCRFHPMILPKNSSNIRFINGKTKEKNGSISEFKYCPTCYYTVYPKKNEKK